MARALIVGAGAIGRGFLPWVLDGFEVDFYEAAPHLVEAMTEHGGYHTYMSTDEGLVVRSVRPRMVTTKITDLPLSGYDIAFVAVGPRNTVHLPPQISQLRCPVFSLENDPATVTELVQTYGLDRVYFGVPDVITSSTASPEHLSEDRLSLHTENGILYLEDAPQVPDELKAAMRSVEWSPVNRLRQEWDAKLYLHNTPHCVAAYLGYIGRFEYLHEGCSVPFIQRTVEGVVEEMLLSLKMATSYDHRFMEAYAAKELRRFSNAQLFDPIRRVAREPLRKLAPAGRLTGALRIAMLAGVAPVNLMVGIAAALRYLEPGDPDSQYLRRLDDFGLTAFLQYHLSIHPRSMESEYITKHFRPASALLERSLPWT